MHKSNMGKGLNAFPKGWVKIVEPIARNLANRFIFGSYSVEDLIQHSYYVVLNESHRFDPDRGPFHSFARTLIHSRLHSLKRDKYERHDPPCQKCPLAAWIPKTNKCKLFDTFDHCSIYSKWRVKNEAKRLLSAPHADSSERNSHCTAEEGVDVEEFFEWLTKIVKDVEGLQILRGGGVISEGRRDALLLELSQCIEGEGLEE